MTFSVDLSKFVEKAKGNADAVVRRATLQIFSKVILRTPVDTGRLKGNWQFGDGSMPFGELTTTDKSGAASIAKVKAGIPKNAAGRIYYLVNNLEYAMAMERGGSKVQAPQGMVGVTVVEFQDEVNKSVREVA